MMDKFTLSRALVPMLAGTPDGRYAAQMDEDKPWRFFRINRPEKGRWAGNTLIQSASSERWILRAYIRDGSPNLIEWHNWNQEAAELVLKIVCDPFMGRLKYSQELTRCSSCGKKLTDPRSMWYYIGPDCEKDHPDFIDWVISEKGEYVP